MPKQYKKRLVALFLSDLEKSVKRVRREINRIIRSSDNPNERFMPAIEREYRRGWVDAYRSLRPMTNGQQKKILQLKELNK